MLRKIRKEKTLYLMDYYSIAMLYKFGATFVLLVNTN